MVKLFTYIVCHDTGVAPNPFGGYCTLVICKPKIREKAKVGDWVAGFGSVNAPSGDLSGKLIYAMKVTEVHSMRDYDRLAKERWPVKVPARRCEVRRCGDCIYYNFSKNLIKAKQRPSVHGPSNITKDLKGKNALVSNHFFYFGNNAIDLPSKLSPIIHQGPGHRCPANNPYVDDFVKWVEKNETGLHGRPDKKARWYSTCKGIC